MLFDLIFVGLLLGGWSFCAFMPWLAVSVATRGNAGLGMLPLCLFAGIVAALAVPLLVDDGWTGLWLSFGAALVAPAMLMGVRRFAREALTPRPPLPIARKGGSPSDSGASSLLGADEGPPRPSTETHQ